MRHLCTCFLKILPTDFFLQAHEIFNVEEFPEKIKNTQVLWMDHVFDRVFDWPFANIWVFLTRTIFVAIFSWKYFHGLSVLFHQNQLFCAPKKFTIVEMENPFFNLRNRKFKESSTKKNIISIINGKHFQNSEFSQILQANEFHIFRIFMGHSCHWMSRWIPDCF